MLRVHADQSRDTLIVEYLADDIEVAIQRNAEQLGLVAAQRKTANTLMSQ